MIAQAGVARLIPQRSLGVSLLEVLVALVILGGSAAVLFEWVLQLNTRLRSIQEQQTVAAAQLRGIEFLNSINPAIRQTGAQRFVDMELRWQAERKTPFRTVLLSSGVSGGYAVAVFEVKAELWQKSATTAAAPGPWVKFNTKLAGWRPNRSTELPWFAAEVADAEGSTDPGTQESDGTEDPGNPSSAPRRRP